MKKLLIIFIFCLSSPFSEYLSAQANPYLLGKVTFEKKEYTQAINYLNQHLQSYPKHSEARLLRAESFLRIFDYSRAADDLAQLKISGKPEIVLLQARAYAGAGNYKAAFEKLHQYKNLGNKSSDVWIKSFAEFNGLKNTTEWSALWKDWKYTEKEILFIDITYAIKSERFDEAADRLDSYLEKYKTNADAYFQRGNLYLRTKDYKNALNCFEKATEMEKSNQVFQYHKALTLSKLNKQKIAVEEFNTLIANDSLAIDAYLGRAEVLLNLNRYNEALADIQKYRHYYSENIDALFIEAKINAKSGDYLNAISSFGKLIKSDPSKPEYFIERADAYFATKTYLYAIKDYSMALDLDPKNIEVYKRKAKAFQLSGDMTGACNEWNNAVRLGDIESVGMIQKYCKGK